MKSYVFFSTASPYLSAECGQQSHSGKSTSIISDTCGSISTVFVWDEDLRGYLYLLRCCEWRSHIMPAVIISTFEKDGPCTNSPWKKRGRVFCQINGSSFYQHEDLMHGLGTQTHSYRQDNMKTGEKLGTKRRIPMSFMDNRDRRSVLDILLDDLLVPLPRVCHHRETELASPRPCHISGRWHDASLKKEGRQLWSLCGLCRNPDAADGPTRT